MFGSLFRKAGMANRIVFVLAVLLSAPVQAQSIVGSWGLQGAPLIVMSFQSSGRWSFTATDPAATAQCGGSALTVGGGYSASGGAVSMTLDSGACGTNVFSGISIPFGSGTYAISGSTLTVHLSSTGGPIDLVLTAQGASTISSTTPLPPPPATQAVFTVPTGRLPAAAVAVSPSGTFGSATLVVTLDLSQVLALGSAEQGQFAAGYNIYVAALAPAGALGLPAASWFVLPATHVWTTLSSPIAAFLSGVAQGAATGTVVINILQGLDVTGLVGTEFYLGYGTSDTEMLTAGRYRGVYKVQ
jgi:hypothetical protein